MRDKDLLKQLIKDGWVEVRKTGSHHILNKGSETIVLPVHGKDVKPGLLNAILKQAYKDEGGKK